MVVCYPYMNAAGMEITECQLIMVDEFDTTASVPYYAYGRWPSVKKQPTFGTTTSLDRQLDDEGTMDCDFGYSGTGESYDGDSACASPATVMNLANSKFTTSSFSLQMSITQPFTTEEAQTTY